MSEQELNQKQTEFPPLFTHSERTLILSESGIYIFNSLESILLKKHDKHNLNKKRFLKKLNEALNQELVKHPDIKEVDDYSIELLIRIAKIIDWNKDTEALRRLKTRMQKFTR